MLRPCHTDHAFYMPAFTLSHHTYTRCICLCRDTVGPDPQVGTVADTYTFEEYREGMLKLLLDNGLPAARAA